MPIISDDFQKHLYAYEEQGVSYLNGLDDSIKEQLARDIIIKHDLANFEPKVTQDNVTEYLLLADLAGTTDIDDKVRKSIYENALLIARNHLKLGYTYNAYPIFKILESNASIDIKSEALYYSAIIQSEYSITDAENAFKELIGLNSKFQGPANYRLGVLYREQGKNLDALACFKEALTSGKLDSKENGALHLELGNIYRNPNSEAYKNNQEFMTSLARMISSPGNIHKISDELARGGRNLSSLTFKPFDGASEETLFTFALKHIPVATLIKSDFFRKLAKHGGIPAEIDGKPCYYVVENTCRELGIDKTTIAHINKKIAEGFVRNAKENSKTQKHSGYTQMLNEENKEEQGLQR